MMLRRFFSVQGRALTDPLNIVRPSSVTSAAGTANGLSKAAQTSVLDSGVRVVSAVNSGAPVASVCVRVEAGSRYESAASAGTAHAFATNLVYGASSKRSGLQVTRALENELPGGFKATATRDAILLYGQVAGADAHTATDRILPLLRELLSPKLNEWELVRARGRVARTAAAEHEKNGAARALDECYGAGFRRQGLGRSLVAANNVSSLLNAETGGVHQVRQFLASRFAAKNVTVTTVGPASASKDDGHKTLEQEVGALFNDLGAGGQLQTDAAEGGSAKFQPAFSLVEAPGSATHVALAMDAAAVSEAEARVVAACIGHPAASDKGILGSGPSHRYVDASGHSLMGQALTTGGHAFDCRLARHSGPQQLLVAQFQFSDPAQARSLLAQFQSGPITATAAQVDRAKLLAANRLLREAEQSHSFLDLLASQAVAGDSAASILQQVEAIQAVTAEQVAAVLKSITSNGIAIGAYGPKVGNLF